jgi:hypothetical protein
MKIISLIQDPDVIRQILKHLGLWKQDADFHRQLLAMCAQNMRESTSPGAEIFIFLSFS